MKKTLLGLSLILIVGCGNSSIQKTEKNNLTVSHFEWNFNKPRKIIYSFYQSIKDESKTAKDSPFNKKDLIGKGYFNVRVKENNLADLSLTDIGVKMVLINNKGIPGDTITQKLQNTVFQNMKSDGSFNDSNTDMMIDMLVPLPKKDLKLGESYEVPMQIPFNVNGSLLYSKGNNILMFEGYEKIEERNCAVLKGKINISDLEIPEELSGEYKCSMIGNSTYYFDLEEGCYVGADLQMIMYTLINFKTDKESDFEWYMETKNENEFKVRLERIEE